VVPTVVITPTAPPVTLATPTPAPGTVPTTTEPLTKPVKVYQTVMTGRDLNMAYATIDQNQTSQYFQRPIIALEFNPGGAQKFAAYTSANVGNYLAIVIDKQVISSPRVETAITEGRAVIQGDFTMDEARGLAAQLQYGALPIPFRVVSERVVDPILGQDSIQKSILAGLIGVFTVLLFMAIYYRVPGLVADVALIIFALVTFALFKLIPVALTLPGIAGFLLSIGMAVDANILIFERMKEELRAGRSLGTAIEAGFDRAWTSIRDSNVSTLITCAILFWFGSNFGAGEVSGFAMTLFLGVVVSMFTAITVTHTIIRVLFFLARDFLQDHPRLLGI
jgi:preprotein translocase subunit SecD